jgi:hypothetical protein
MNKFKKIAELETAHQASNELVHQESGRNKIEALSGRDFCKEYEPVDFLIDSIIEETRLYTLTAPTGTGKTAVSLLIAESVALGKSFAGNITKQAGVLILSGENPSDVRVRFMAMCDRNPELKDAPIYFTKDPFSIEDKLDEIYDIFKKHPDIKLVIVDTLQAFFDGEDSNSNTEKIAFAQTLRTICSWGVAVLVNAHPTKSATRDTNEPYGGGSFVNEVDGNLALWSDGDGSIDFYWCKKFRGSFENFSLELIKVEVESAQNSRGERLNTVIAKVIGDVDRVSMNNRAQLDDIKALDYIKNNSPLVNRNEIARHLKWNYINGKPDGSRVKRSISRLMKEKLVTENAYGVSATKKGKDWGNKNAVL